MVAGHIFFVVFFWFFFWGGGGGGGGGPVLSPTSQSVALPVDLFIASNTKPPSRLSNAPEAAHFGV